MMGDSMSVIDVMSEAAGSLDYAADALEAPVGSHMRAASIDLKAARNTVKAMLAALEAIEAYEDAEPAPGTREAEIAAMRRAVIKQAKGESK